MAIINFNSISGVTTISVASSITVGSGVTITATSITAPTFVGNVSATTGITTVTQLNVGTGGTVITTTSSGSVGIGTTNPASNLKLDIFQTSGGNAVSISNNTALAFRNSSGTAQRAALLSPTNTYYYGDVDNSTSGSTLFLMANNSISLFTNGNANVSLEQNGNFRVGASGTTLSGITSTGFVGIGTTNPLGRLSVGDPTNTSGQTNDIYIIGDKVSANGFYSRLMFKNSNQSGGSTASIRAERNSNNFGTALSFYTNGTSSAGDGTLKLIIDSTGYLATPNNIDAGLDIGYKKSVSITGSFSANTWYNTGIDRTTDTGIYLVSAYFDTYAAGGQSYQMRYVGWFVLPAQSTNSGDATTIALHRAGHAPNSETLQLRTLLTASANSNIYLQWLSNFSITLDGSPGKNLQIVLHRFATALGG